VSSLRNRRRQETSDTISRVAIELAYSHGLENVTTEMIANAAGISPRTFFNYFPFKEAALAPQEPEISEAAFTRFIASKASLTDGLLELLEPLYDQIGTDPSLIIKAHQVCQSSQKLLALQQSAFLHFEEKCAGILGQRLQISPTDASIRQLAAIIVASIRIGAETWGIEGTGTVRDHVKTRLELIRVLLDNI